VTSRPTEVIWGLPGTGKTTTLLDRLERELDNGVPLENIVASTFRTDMADEFKERAKEKIEGDELPDNHMLRNIHSICFRLAGLDTEQVVHHGERRDVCREVGIPYEIPGKKVEDDRDWLNLKDHGNELGNQLFNVRQYTINTFKDPVRDWREASFLTQDQRDELSDYIVERFNNEYEEIKEEKGMIDFDDMLLWCYNNNITPNCEVLIEDEFQDKSPLQVELYRQFAEDASRVYIAGDVFQTLYSFMGAQPDLFEEEIERAKKNIELDTSHRFGPKLWGIATGVLKQAGYDYIPDVEPIGETEVMKISWDQLGSILRDIRNEETFHLTRTNYHGREVADRLVSEAVPFTSKSKRWTQKQLDFYTGVIKTRRVLQQVSGLGYPKFDLSASQMKLLMDSYPVKCFSSKKKEMKNKIDEEGKKAPFATYINDNFVERVTAPNPFYPTHMLSSAFDNSILERLQRAWAKIGMEELQNIGHKVSTIHGAKGMERRVNVVYLGTSKKIMRNLDSERGRKEEARVWFTALTRTKNKAIIVDNMPETESHDLGVSV